MERDLELGKNSQTQAHCQEGRGGEGREGRGGRGGEGRGGEGRGGEGRGGRGERGWGGDGGWGERVGWGRGGESVYNDKCTSGLTSSLTNKVLEL